MCSSNSVGRSVNVLVWESVVIPFRLGFPSPATVVAIFTVYHDYLISKTPPLLAQGGVSGAGHIRRFAFLLVVSCTVEVSASSFIIIEFYQF